MQKEYDSILENDTWELTKLPKNNVSIGSSWLFKYTFNYDSSIDKFKSRLVKKDIHKNME